MMTMMMIRVFFLQRLICAHNNSSSGRGALVIVRDGIHGDRDFGHNHDVGASATVDQTKLAI